MKNGKVETFHKSGEINVMVILSVLELWKWVLVQKSVSSVTQSCLGSLWLHGLQHTRFPYPSLSSRVCSNSCPFSQWCYPTVSYFIVPFSSCFQSFPPSGSFPMNWFFASGGQNIAASASATVFPINIQGWLPLGLTGLISMLSKGKSSPAPQFESINSLAISLLYGPTFTSIHDYWKNHKFDYMHLWLQSNISAF